MKRKLKITGKIFLSILLLIITFIIVSFINHKIQLSNENTIFKETIGTPVNVNGHKMNVYTEGVGENTIVFLSGGGTCSPILDFKSLYSQLSDTYKIAVVEKAGYGFSEVTKDIPRDIDTVLSETRQALILAGVQGPYVLCPHSMSGIESLYWAQQYPDEVKAIIGLDMSVPEVYENYSINIPLLKLSSFAASIGITRWFPSLSESDAMKYGKLSEKEKDLYKAIFYRRTATTDMLNEVEQIKDSAKKVAQGNIPTIPILMFSSNGIGTGYDELQWGEYQTEFIKSCKDGTLIKLNVTHYVHDIEYIKISEEIKNYLKKIKGIIY